MRRYPLRTKYEPLEALKGLWPSYRNHTSYSMQRCAEACRNGYLSLAQLIYQAHHRYSSINLVHLFFVPELSWEVRHWLWHSTYTTFNRECLFLTALDLSDLSLAEWIWQQSSSELHLEEIFYQKCQVNRTSALCWLYSRRRRPIDLRRALTIAIDWRREKVITWLCYLDPTLANWTFALQALGQGQIHLASLVYREIGRE